MNPEDFIAQLSQEAGIDANQAASVHGILESTFLAGIKNKEMITKLISEKLGVDQAQANMIYDIAVGLLATGVLSKIKGIFKK